jgi:exopolysaccharide biosynthesis WecB/TagA/CpsF family protein
LSIRGTHAGYFNETEKRALLKQINIAKPALILIGMGMPRQEFFAEELRSKTTYPPVVICVGALFEYLSGNKFRGPHILTRYGFEWLCRSIASPNLFFSRYLTEIPLFICKVIRQKGLPK